MATLIDVLPKDGNGQIKLPVAGEINGQTVEGTSDPNWLTENFASLASANLPLSALDFAALQAIGPYWSQCATAWRAQGLI